MKKQSFNEPKFMLLIMCKRMSVNLVGTQDLTIFIVDINWLHLFYYHALSFDFCVLRSRFGFGVKSTTHTNKVINDDYGAFVVMPNQYDSTHVHALAHKVIICIKLL